MTRLVAKKKAPLKLYWVETPDHHEDWFVIARTAKEARSFFEDVEGYDDHEARSHVIAQLPDALQCETGPLWTAPEVGPYSAPCWPSEEHLKACGGLYLMKGGSRVVQLGGRTYAEGLLEREVGARLQRGRPTAPAS